jgi:DNA replication protein DnaC
MLKYCRDFETETAKSYFFHGRTGTGKTFIATSIGHDLLRRGHSVYFLSFSEMMQQLQQYRILTSSFNPDPIRLEQAERFYQQIHTTDLLILDDLGSGIGDGGIHASELLGLMNSRFSQKKPMLITTNLDTAKILKLYDERLLSRLLGSFVPVYFYGEDVRTIRRRR